MKRSVLFDKLLFILAMVSFGSIGVFRQYIPIPSAMLACIRGLIGALCLFAAALIFHHRFDFSSIKRYWIKITVSGVLIGLNWLLLFESFRYIPVSTATLCYYSAPIIAFIVSPLIYRNRYSVPNIVCCVLAGVGMIFVSGVLEPETRNDGSVTGVLLALGAAVCYATVILINRGLAQTPPMEKTAAQLFFAGICLIPYVIFVDIPAFSVEALNLRTVLLILFVSVYLTGICYAMYFRSMPHLSAQAVSIYSYLDPVTAIILSALVLHEKMNLFVIIGGILIICSSLINEILENKKSQTAG